jgi:hypothetical protein
MENPNDYDEETLKERFYLQKSYIEKIIELNKVNKYKE